MKSTGKELVKQQENLDLEILNGDIEKAEEEGRRILSVPFSYDKFIAYARNIQKRTLQDDLNLIRLLYRANRELSQSGYRSDFDKYKTDITWSHVRPGSDFKTFKDFYTDLKISKATAYRLLAAYNAEEDRLYTKDELKELAEEAWNNLCEEIHGHRINGEPDWKPDNWNESLELRYDSWLIAHGYKNISVDTSILNDSRFHSYDYPSFGPFTFSFIDSIGHYCIEETSGDGAIRFYEMTERYKNRIPKGIEPNNVLRIPVMVKGAIAQLPKEARKEATILVANILRDYVEDEV